MNYTEGNGAPQKCVPVFHGLLEGFWQCGAFKNVEQHEKYKNNRTFDSVKKISIQRARGQNASWTKHNRRLRNPNRWKAGCNLPPDLSNIYSTCFIRTAGLEDMETGVRIMLHWISWQWSSLYRWSIKDLFPLSKKHHTI